MLYIFGVGGVSSKAAPLQHSISPVSFPLTPQLTQPATAMAELERHGFTFDQFRSFMGSSLIQVTAGNGDRWVSKNQVNEFIVLQEWLNK